MRLLTFVPAIGIIAIDPGEPRGILQVDVYSHRLTGRKPSIVLRAGRDHQWYTHFLDEFDQIWSTGDPVPPQSYAEGKR